MELLLYVAASLCIALSAAHSYLGEKYILIRLFRRENLPKIFGDTRFTQKTLRFAWHITSVAWIGFAALLVHAGREDLTVSGMLRIIGITFMVSGLFPLIATRGRHLAWLVFFAIGGISLWCGS
ncbi:MAG TPA: hypothetical protein VL995_00535 [Cellvibrio sp.]|nr:hypothetical protein [Cellvibrio sp.]